MVRALVGIVSATALFAGVLEIHPADEAHGLGAAEYYACDGPHSRQLHAETARARQRPSCPICLHRLQTSGLHLADGSAAQVLPAVRRLVPSTPPATLSASQASPGARAPPQFS